MQRQYAFGARLKPVLGQPSSKLERTSAAWGGEVGVRQQNIDRKGEVGFVLQSAARWGRFGFSIKELSGKEEMQY